MNVNGNITILAWINPESFPQEWCHIVGGYESGGSYPGYALAIGSTGDIAVWNGTSWQVSTDGIVSTGSLQHVGYTNDNTDNTYYYAGSSDSTDTAGNPNSYAGVRAISADASGAQEFDGIIDELQIHSAARSAAWIGEEYAQTNNNATFWGS